MEETNETKKSSTKMITLSLEEYNQELAQKYSEGYNDAGQTTQDNVLAALEALAQGRVQVEEIRNASELKPEQLAFLSSIAGVLKEAKS